MRFVAIVIVRLAISFGDVQQPIAAKLFLPIFRADHMTERNILRLDPAANQHIPSGRRPQISRLKWPVCWAEPFQVGMTSEFQLTTAPIFIAVIPGYPILPKRPASCFLPR